MARANSSSLLSTKDACHSDKDPKMLSPVDEAKDQKSVADECVPVDNSSAVESRVCGTKKNVPKKTKKQHRADEAPLEIDFSSDNNEEDLLNIDVDDLTNKVTHCEDRGGSIAARAKEPLAKRKRLVKHQKQAFKDGYLGTIITPHHVLILFSN